MSFNSELTTVNVDVETQISEINQIQLKGILIRHAEKSAEQAATESCILKICKSLIVIVIITPITICDLYFGFTDTTCSREEPDELAISLRLYLLASGFSSAVAMLLLLCGICLIGPTDKINDSNCCMVCCGSFGLITASLFGLIWNILGAIVFWGYIYGNGNCDKTFSTYVFVSLIIKLISLLTGMLSNKKENKK